MESHDPERVVVLTSTTWPAILFLPVALLLGFSGFGLTLSAGRALFGSALQAPTESTVIGVVFVGLGLVASGALFLPMAALVLSPGHVELSPQGLTVGLPWRRGHWGWDDVGEPRVVAGRMRVTIIPLDGAPALTLGEVWSEKPDAIAELVREARARATSGPTRDIQTRANRGVLAAVSAAIALLATGVALMLYAQNTVTPYNPTNGEPHRFAAIAVSSDQQIGRDWAATEDLARMRACRRAGGRRCLDVVVVGRGRCVAFAGPVGQMGVRSAQGADHASATRSALASCSQAEHRKCELLSQICADELG